MYTSGGGDAAWSRGAAELLLLPLRLVTLLVRERRRLRRRWAGEPPPPSVAAAAAIAATAVPGAAAVAGESLSGLTSFLDRRTMIRASAVLGVLATAAAWRELADGGGAVASTGEPRGRGTARTGVLSPRGREYTAV